jgi:hypothetical protein
LFLVDFIVEVDYNQQPRKMMFGSSGCEVIIFFGATNLYKKMMKCNKTFLKLLMLYLYKGYKPLSTCKNIWLQSLVLCQCPYVVFPFCSFWVEEVILAMMKKNYGFTCVA